MTLRLENASRGATGLLLAEDTVPYALGARPRYVLDKIERNGTRDLTYPLRSDLRGKFEIGPLQLRMTDSFGLVELSRSLTGKTTFVVTPRVVPLARTVISRSWAGEGEGRSRLASTAGEDDAIPRAYRDGDELRRVHWRSTARYGTLMVRREEQRWRNRATVLLDTRMSAHQGSGPASSFEAAVSAAASLGVHISQEGLTGQFITDADAIRGGPFFEDSLLDALAVIRMSGRTNPAKRPPGTARQRRGRHPRRDGRRLGRRRGPASRLPHRGQSGHRVAAGGVQLGSGTAQVRAGRPEQLRRRAVRRAAGPGRPAGRGPRGPDGACQCERSGARSNRGDRRKRPPLRRAPAGREALRTLSRSTRSPRRTVAWRRSCRGPAEMSGPDAGRPWSRPTTEPGWAP